MKNFRFIKFQRIVALIFLITTLISGCKEKDENPIETKESMSQMDQEFMKKAGIFNASEIDISQLVREKSTNAYMKEYATLLFQDHTKAQNELINLGALKQVFVPNEPDSLHKAMKEKLAKLNDAKFDSAYLAMLVINHKRSIQDFDKAAKESKDRDVKHYAHKFIPNLYKHLIKADSVQKSKK